MISQFILLMVFLLTVFYIYILYEIFFSKKGQIVQRLKGSITDQDTEYKNVSGTHPSVRDQVGGVFNLFAKFFYLKKYLLNRKRRLSQAAIMMKPEEFMAISIFAGIFGTVITLVLRHSILISVLFFIIGIKVPDLILNILKTKRLKRLNEQLPEALSILANGLRAGYSFIQSMDVASKELEGPIAEEFAKTIHDNSVGKPIEECMLEMSDRTNNEDMDLFITALIIQRQVGGNLAEILDTISETIRERVKVTGEIRTLTAEGKMSAAVIALLPIALSIVIGFLNPNYIQVLITTDIGRIMILASVLMEAVGIFFLKKIVTINI